MPSFFKSNWKLLSFALLSGIALRLLFVLHWPVVQGDSLIYAEIAKNVLNHGIYGMTHVDGVHSTLIRLPGYPLFLAACFKLFGQDNFRAVMLVQLLFDIASCFLIADVARRLVSDRAAKFAFVIACLWPFTANYVGTALTETLEIFFTIAAVDAAVIAFDRRSLRWWAVCGLAVAAAIQLRPDGGLLLGAIGLVIVSQLLRDRKNRPHIFAAGVVLAAVSLAPLVPWAYRNWKVFHVFQPLVTLSASDPDEYVIHGWDRWVKTWALDYSTTEDLTFHVSGEEISMAVVPSRAFDSAQERDYVARLFEEYNQTRTMTPALDDRFDELAAQKIRQHPLRFHIALPAARAAMLWLRPRTEMLPLDTHWWNFGEDLHDSLIASLLGLLNAALVVLALLGLLYRHNIRWLGLLVVYPIVRTLLLMKMGALEDRYTLECFPMVFILAAAWLALRSKHNIVAQSEQLQPALPLVEGGCPRSPR